MVDWQILKEKQITPEALKSKLAGNPLHWTPTTGTDMEKRVNLWRRIRSRVQEGMDRNFANYKVYHALDRAWNTPFRQITPTLLMEFLDSDPTEEQVQNKLKDWGLTHLITEQLDPRSGKPTGKKVIDLPLFWNVFVPLCRAYVTIRWARIMNDRRLIPFFKYEPVKVTSPLKAKCEVITDRVQVIATQYGWYDVMKQSVLKMLHYGFCLQFPVEAWHSVEQLKKADATDVKAGKKKPDGEPASVGDTIKVTEREGLRYHHPHPTRCFRDLNHGAYTYNYDSGCEFAGYWHICRYRDLAENKAYWNSDQVSIGASSLIDQHQAFFSSVYSACTLQIPVLKAASTDGNVMAATQGVGVEELDREKQLANSFYGTDHMDQGCLVTEYFERLVPSANGLGDYDYPVWFRFVLAGDQSTFIYAEPLPFNPIVYYGYDEDASQVMNASLTLEALPFQDQFSNVLTQILHTARQNLSNLVMVDESQVTDAGILANIQGLGHKLFKALNVFPYDSKKAARAQNRPADVIQSFTFPKGNVAELISVLKTILDVLERVLVMSSHEVAQPASHEQTREEVRNIATSTTSRLMFTATPVDIAGDAWKRQIFMGLMAFGDDDFYAHLPSEVMLTQEQLEKLGFTFIDQDEGLVKSDRHRAVKIKKSATAINLWEIASTRDGNDRSSDREVAASLSQLAMAWMNNPLMAQAIGADQAIDMANAIAQLAGLPRDFKLRNMAPGLDAQQQQAQAQQQLAEISKVVLEQVQQQMQADLVPLLDMEKETRGRVDFIVKALNLPVPNPTNDSPARAPAK